MSYTMIEPVLDGVVSQISSGMAAKVSALNSEFGDTLLTAPANYLKYDPGDELPDGISIVALPGISEFEIETQTWGDCNHNLSIFAFVYEQDEQTLLKMLMRYNRAIIELIRADLTLGGVPGVYNTTILSASPIWSEYEKRVMLLGSLIEIVVSKQEGG